MAEEIKPPRASRFLDLTKQWQQGTWRPPIAELVGFTLAEVEVGRAVTEMDAGPRHANAVGTLHGGVICDLADAAMGAAIATTVEEGESFTTLDLNAKYFKPVWSAHLRAVARVTRRTRTLGLIECEVTDAGGSLVAKVFSTCMVLRGDEARGR
ncbi:MAG TPA: PaaI family thioesterase [Myxococcales bacterium]|nr:PaaI family thioesterase [Myxococcales bacterium]